ncbi:MAG: hypothetical protein KGV57_04825, partial [Fusobacterium sp.]|nr:hypothetical protein [Fusobacterium sp.]
RLDKYLAGITPKNFIFTSINYFFYNIFFKKLFGVWGGAPSLAEKGDSEHSERGLPFFILIFIKFIT